jgi:uncharacterized protein (DUF362 family)/Pyruvate/2-oxoacid:ferredoxin oxidoreductase delta subunit
MARTNILVTRCPSYDAARLRECVRQCLAHADPDSTHVSSGKKVLLKVNMLSARLPEKAVTTHPALVQAVAEVCAERGAEVRIGDSPAGSESDIEHYWERTGFSAAARAAGAELVGFAASGSFRAEIDGTAVHVANAVRDADTVINLPKLKTHNLTMMTGAVKNCYGALPGPQKAALHTQRPGAGEFSRLLVELHRLVDPAITIMDAITVMHGNGPAGGDTKDMGLLLAGSNAAAIDWVASRMLGFRPEDVPTNAIARELGLTDPGDIEMTGDTVPPEGPGDFVLPTNLVSARIQAWALDHLPGFASRLLSRMFSVTPRMTADCVACGECVEKCPADALALEGGKVALDRKACIGCMCCREVCPHDAVEVRMSLLARMIRMGQP